MYDTLKQQDQTGVRVETSENQSKSNWYVFYTAPRAEKVAQRELLTKGYDVFLPTTKTSRTWKNRQKKIIDQVLFPSYIFVKTEERHLSQICQLPKIATYIHCGGRPSRIHHKCIEGIKRMLDSELEISVETNFSEGENVRLVSGPLAGFEGILVKQQSRMRFGIQLTGINQTVFIDISSSSMEKRSGF